MAKRKAAAASSDDEDDSPQRVESESPERPLQTARRGSKKAKKTKDESDESEEETLKKSVKKPQIGAKPSSTKKSKTPAKEALDEDTGDVNVGVNERGEKFVDLGKKRRATVTTFKGAVYVDVREFWGDDGDLKPGKKGIMLGKDQWDALKKSVEVIDSLVSKAKK